MTPLETLNVSLIAGMDPNAWNDEGIAPIHYASEQGYSDCIAPLAAAGAELDAKSRYGSTALHISADYGDFKTLVALIDCGADVNIEDEDGDIPIMISMGRGDLDCVEVLLEAGSLPERTAYFDGKPDDKQQECVDRINAYMEQTVITVVEA